MGNFRIVWHYPAQNFAIAFGAVLLGKRSRNEGESQE